MRRGQFGLAGPGAPARAVAAHAPFDVAILDLQMGDMDGFETTSRNRARGAHPRRTAIITMTATVLAGDCERCLVAGMDDDSARHRT